MSERRRHRERRTAGGVHQPPFRQPRLRYRPIEVISADQLEAIHQASLRILAEMGMEVLLDEARDILKGVGAEVDGLRVRLDPALVESFIGVAPESFTLHARNPDHSVVVGGDHMAFCTVGSAPNVADRAGGRRPGNFKDFCGLLRLAQSLNAIHLNGGYPVEPIDLHASTRHLDALSAVLTLTDKAPNCYSLGKERNRDAIELVRIARGVDDATLDEEPSVFTIINTNSPLKLDNPMSQGIIEMARRGQVTCVTPFTLAGAMAPITIAGAVAQQNAEALMGLVLTQAVKRGAPFVYGGFTSNVDMKSGAPAFGTPEYMKTAMMGGQLARRYRLPYRSSNVNAANTVDAQAAYESVFALWGAVMGGCNLMKHGAGWMEGGLQASFEKMVLDADLLQMVMAFLDPPVVDDDALGLDAIREVGPGGHFFGCAHTQERYETAFFAPMLSDWRNAQAWEIAGRPDAYQKAEQVKDQLLAAYEEPPMDEGIREELAAFVARRKEEGGAPTDF
ncbi:MAG: trimethylamine methyltransferase family protein [Geminicoccaceae bacterium]|nr:trimethylamine methyltransferase family protein [Geminicoccaceae bacterium]